MEGIAGLVSKPAYVMARMNLTYNSSYPDESGSLFRDRVQGGFGLIA